MLMIGVMPLPALMNSILAGNGAGSVNTPFYLAEPDQIPGLDLLHQVRRHHAAVHLLRRHADQTVFG